MNLLGSKTYNNSLYGRLNDVWGHVDSLGNEYAIVGLQKGVSIVNVTNPSNLNEVFYVSGVSSTWRDIKTWNNHAYITNESSGGMMIIDMSSLPGTIKSTDVYYYTGTNYSFSKAHNIYVDEGGVAYIFGANNGNKGAIFLDLNGNPKVPTELGVYDSLYFHDGMARGDTLWGAAIWLGKFVAIDVSNKTAPVLLNSYFTSGYFTHNCWISSDGNTLFTTDEKSNGAIGSYDVSDISNISELDLVRSNPGSGVIPHNTHVMGDFLINSYYRDGVTVVDATHPDQMVEVGNYDTTPLQSGNGFSGVWGAYPFLPSGNILATDIFNGLFVLGVEYTKGVYIQGNTLKFSDSSGVAFTQITSVNTGEFFSSSLNGSYKGAFADSGWHRLAFYKPGYLRDTTDIYMVSGQMHTLDIYLRKQTAFKFSGVITDADNNLPVENAEVFLEEGYLKYRAITNSTGYFEIDSVFEGPYEVTAGKWKYANSCTNISISSGDSTNIKIQKEIYDDFTFDNGWTAVNNGSNGFWEFENLISNPSLQSIDYPIEDNQSDCAHFAFVTGKAFNGDHDVDGGWNYLTSPVMDARGIGDPEISFSYWFRNDASAGNDDSLNFYLISGQDTSALLKVHNATNLYQSVWIDTSFILSGFNPDLSNIRLMAKIGDFNNDDLLEGGLDYVRIRSSYVGISVVKNKADFKIYPNPFDNIFYYQLPEEFNGDAYEIMDITGRTLLKGQDIELEGSIRLPSSIPNGLLIVRFSNAYGETMTKRMIKRDL